MKKLFIAAATVGASVGAFAQGTISFQDATIAPKIYVQTPGGSSLAPQKAFTVSLYWASASGGTLAPIFTGLANVAADGDFYFSTAVSTPTQTAPGGTAEFEVVGWTGTWADLATAKANNALTGNSNPFLNSTGGAGTPAGTPVNLTGWSGNVLLTAPEPTTIALGGLGAAALLLFRRRK